MKKKFLLSVFLFAASGLAVLPALEVPELKGRVNDLAGIIDSSTENDLSAYLEAIEEQTGAQLAVLTIPSLEGRNLESFSYLTASSWKLGQEKEDNGVLLLIAYAERKIRIEVGYGLEGELTDAKSGYIIRQYITPYFKQGNYSEGISEGVRAIGSVIAGDLVITDRQARPPSSVKPSTIFYLIIILLFLGFRVFLFAVRNGSSGSSWTSRGGGFFSGGSSSGGGGGGFSGGGGSFGGGGASGGW